MAAAVINFSIEQGASFNAEVRFTDFDFTDFVFRGQIRSMADITQPLLGTITVTLKSATLDTLQLSMTATETSDLPVTGKAYNDIKALPYDIEAENTVTGVVLRLCNGYLKISPQVTG